MDERFRHDSEVVGKASWINGLIACEATQKCESTAF